MKMLRDERADYWISRPILEEFPEAMNDHFWGVHDALEKTGREFVQAYGAAIGAERIGILVAHGDYTYGSDGWTYSDGREDRTVQSWIDEHDGKYALLAIRCCNPAASTPIAKKSLLLVPDSTFSDFTVGQGYSHFSLIHPTEGDLEYTIEYMLDQLRKTRKA
jgi:hypothetical protein